MKIGEADMFRGRLEMDNVNDDYTQGQRSKRGLN